MKIFLSSADALSAIVTAVNFSSALGSVVDTSSSSEMSSSFSSMSSPDSS